MNADELARAAAEAMRRLPGWKDFCAVEAPEEDNEVDEREAA